MTVFLKTVKKNVFSKVSKTSKNDRNLNCKKNKLTIIYLPDLIKLFSFL